MEFFLYTFDSDYLKETFIALENASLLRSRLPKKTPRVFFTRDIQRDCECEILVVETLRKDALQWRRTQKLARTVLVTSTPFTSLSAYLAMRLSSAHVFMNKEEILFSMDVHPIAKPEETELEKFSKQFGIERSHELDHFAGLLDVGMLKRRLWLVGSIRGGRREGARPSPRVTETQISKTVMTGYRDVFRSSLGEPSELRPLTSIRQRDTRSAKSYKVRNEEAEEEAEICDVSYDDWECSYILGEDLVLKIRSNLIMIDNRMVNFEKKKRRGRRRMRMVTRTVGEHVM